MAGHSKWANIQHRKGAQDAKRGKLFSRLIREVSISARIGGPSPEGNPRLRQAMDKALAGNVPKDTIERAIRPGERRRRSREPRGDPLRGLRPPAGWRSSRTA